MLERWFAVFDIGLYQVEAVEDRLAPLSHVVEIHLGPEKEKNKDACQRKIRKQLSEIRR